MLRDGLRALLNAPPEIPFFSFLESAVSQSGWG
jgi:hypothetical protein